jgi:hypothetical protein
MYEASAAAGQGGPQPGDTVDPTGDADSDDDDDDVIDAEFEEAN